MPSLPGAVAVIVLCDNCRAMSTFSTTKNAIRHFDSDIARYCARSHGNIGLRGWMCEGFIESVSRWSSTPPTYPSNVATVDQVYHSPLSSSFSPERCDLSRGIWRGINLGDCGTSDEAVVR